MSRLDYHFSGIYILVLVRKSVELMRQGVCIASTSSCELFLGKWTTEIYRCVSHLEILTHTRF